MCLRFFFSSRRRHTRWNCDWSSDVCSSDLCAPPAGREELGRHARVDIHRLRQFLLRDALLGGVGDVNAAGPNEERLPPGTFETWNVRREGHHCCGQTIDLCQLYGWRVEDFACFPAACRRRGHRLPSLRRIADRAKHDFRFGVIGDHVGCAAATDGADIQRAAAEQSVLRQRNLANVVENIEQRVDGGMTEFGIGGVREFSVSRDFVAQRAFRTEGETVLGGLAIDEESRAAGSCGGGYCTGAVAFFAYDEEEADIARAGSEQFFCGSDHGSN